MIKPNSAKPKSAPALVACTICETPILVAAHTIPGPKSANTLENFIETKGEL